MELKNKIQELRKNKNLSQEKLAEMLKISRQAVAKWETGENTPDIGNLVELSYIFNVSLDRLLKDEECADKFNTIDYKENEIIDFLIRAKKATYAGNGTKEEISSRPNSQDLKYQEGQLKYIDTYLGGEKFIGEEVVFVNDIPIWGMNYYGIEINEKFSSNFLKQALLNVDKDMPYRGKSIFKDGDYTYTCNVEGNFEYFSGNETIYFQEEKVFVCCFTGGIIK